MEVRLIGVTGGSGSGKSTVVRRIMEAQPNSVAVAMDNYYISAPFVTNENITAVNFDHPDAFDIDLMLENLRDLKAGKAVMMPQYDFVCHRRLDEYIRVEPKSIVIVDGLMVFHDKRIRDLLISSFMSILLRISVSSGVLSAISRKEGVLWKAS